MWLQGKFGHPGSYSLLDLDIALSLLFYWGIYMLYEVEVAFYCIKIPYYYAMFSEYQHCELGTLVFFFWSWDWAGFSGTVSVQSIKRDYIHQLSRQADWTQLESLAIAMEFLNFFDSSHQVDVLKFLLFLLILLLLLRSKFTRII